MSRPLLAILLLLIAPLSFGQEADADSASVADDAVDRFTTSGADSTVIYEAEFFAQYNPVTANDMLERIPGIDLENGGPDDDNDRGLGTGGNLLINGQRIAGKENAAQDQLNRIPANEVERIEIIRDTSGELNVRGAGEVINIILNATQSRSSTTVELVNRLNHDDTFETGGSVGWSRQSGNFQALVNLELRPKLRESRQPRSTPGPRRGATWHPVRNQYPRPGRTHVLDQHELQHWAAPYAAEPTGHRR